MAPFIRLGCAALALGWCLASPDVALVHADAGVCDRWISLKTSAKGAYLCAEGGGGSSVSANRESAGDWERFRLIDLNCGDLKSGDGVQLATSNGHFVVAEGGGGAELKADRTQPGPWETFTLEIEGGGVLRDGSIVSFKSSAGKYVVAEEGGGGAVNANRNEVGPWEKFAAAFVVSGTADSGTAPPQGSTPIAVSPRLVAVDTRPPGLAPTGLQAVATGPCTVTLTWTAAPGATGYTVSRATSATSEYKFTTSAPLTTTTFRDASLTPGMAYWWRVLANHPDHAAGASAPVTCMTRAAINPADFAATVTGPGIVELSWSPVPDAVFYWIQGPGVQPQKLPALPVLSQYQVPGLPPGTHTFSLLAHYGEDGAFADASHPARTTVTVPIYRGNYRITINGFTCHSTTDDDALQRDGKGDEVYISAFVREYKVGGVITKTEVHSAVFGDRNGFPDRIAAGRASDLGGILDGTAFPNVASPALRNGEPTARALPLLIWQGELVDRNSLVIVTPTIWEWDGSHPQYDRYVEWNALASDYLQAVGIDHPERLYLEAFGTPVRSVIDHISAYDGDRPIGIRRFDRVVVVTRNAVEAALASSSQGGSLLPGVIELRYRDAGDLRGDYTLYLQVERMP